MMRAMSAVALAGSITLGGCVNLQGEGQCRDTVTVNHAANERNVGLNAAPPVLTVCRGATIRIRIVPPDKAASTAAKPGNPGWLNGNVEAGGDIMLTVPENEQVGAEREYSISVDGVGTLDPLFRIVM